MFPVSILVCDPSPGPSESLLSCYRVLTLPSLLTALSHRPRSALLRVRHGPGPALLHSAHLRSQVTIYHKLTTPDLSHLKYHNNYSDVSVSKIMSKTAPFSNPNCSLTTSQQMSINPIDY